MFTGIINAIGTVIKVESDNGDSTVTIDAGKLELADVNSGDSICVNGVCLTVVTLTTVTFSVDVSSETLACTTLNEFAAGSRVNLEKALKIGDRLDGHYVSGHVDGTGKVISITDAARSREYQIEAPADLTRYLCRKGSICVDGVSLTINSVSERLFSVNIIPHTHKQTIFEHYQPGSRVNLEVDIIARYLEGLAGKRE